jgi:hypothetical protein
MDAVSQQRMVGGAEEIANTECLRQTAHRDQRARGGEITASSGRPGEPWPVFASSASSVSRLRIPLTA